MSHEFTNNRLAQLHEAAERISANLVDLEIDSGRRLLEASKLEGESAARWSDANAALTELWRRHGLLESLLSRADELRGARRTDELLSLLTGQSIELASSEVPLAERNLLAPPEATDRCSPDELLAGMSGAFDEVKTVVSRIGAAWDRLMPAVDNARRMLGQASRLADELGQRDRADLAAAGRELSALGDRVSTDPLSVQVAELDELTRRLEQIGAELDADAALKSGFEARILEARDLLERLDSQCRAALVAHDELLVKISGPAAPPAPAGYEHGEQELAEITALAKGGAWSQARSALDAWKARVEGRLDAATRSLEASRAPIEARNQLRALLDAYQVKAQAVGMVEDTAVAESFARAQAVLYDAPTDLAVAAQLVRGYQEMINGSGSRSGAIT